jgi:hypothetical protein
MHKNAEIGGGENAMDARMMELWRGYDDPPAARQSRLRHMIIGAPEP